MIFPLDSSALDPLNDILDFGFPYGLRLCASLVGTRWSNSCRPPNLNFSLPPWWAGCLPDTSSVSDVLNEMQIKSKTQHYFSNSCLWQFDPMSSHNTLCKTPPGLQGSKTRAGTAPDCNELTVEWKGDGKWAKPGERRKAGFTGGSWWPYCYTSPCHPLRLFVSESHNVPQGFRSERKPRSVRKSGEVSRKK